MTVAALVFRCPNCQEDVVEDTQCPLCGKTLTPKKNDRRPEPILAGRAPIARPKEDRQ